MSPHAFHPPNCPLSTPQRAPEEQGNVTYTLRAHVPACGCAEEDTAELGTEVTAHNLTLSGAEYQILLTAANAAGTGPPRRLFVPAAQRAGTCPAAWGGYFPPSGTPAIPCTPRFIQISASRTSAWSAAPCRCSGKPRAPVSRPASSSNRCRELQNGAFAPNGSSLPRASMWREVREHPEPPPVPGMGPGEGLTGVTGPCCRSTGHTGVSPPGRARLVPGAGLGHLRPAPPLRRQRYVRKHGASPAPGLTTKRRFLKHSSVLSHSRHRVQRHPPCPFASTPAPAMPPLLSSGVRPLVPPVPGCWPSTSSATRLRGTM